MNTLKKIISTKSEKFALLLFLAALFLYAKYRLMDQFAIADGKPVFNLILVMMAFLGGIISLNRMQLWGGINSKLGKVLFFYSLGFFAWAGGTLLWMYYYFFLSEAVPYPSLADLFYVLINPSFITAFALLGSIISVKSLQKNKKEKLLFIMPILMAALTFYITYVISHDGILIFGAAKLFLDFYYSVGDIIQVVILILIMGSSFNYLGKRLRLPIILLIACIPLSYTADTLFAYTTSVGIYANGGVVDLLFVFILLILSLGVSNLHPNLLKDSQNEIW